VSAAPKSRWREFLASPHHAALALCTLGAGFLSAEPLYLIVGAAAYVVGWIYVPDLPLFRRYIERKQATAQQAAEQTELAEFQTRRDALLRSLSSGRREQYLALAGVCRDLEKAAIDQPDDPRLCKIEELMWTYLRLLAVEESLETFLETEARDDVPAALAAAREEVERLTAEAAASPGAGASAAQEARERLLASRRELLETLGKRASRIETARANLALVVAEQERLDQQIKLIRADALATRNATALSARIDATVEHLEHTHQWLAQMDQFRDLLTDVPLTAQRAGFGDRPVASVTQQTPQRRKERT
jgi:hypothetical protein